MKLTLPQQDVYFEQLFFPNEPIYNIGAKIEIAGPLNQSALNQAYITLINQHDAYRTVLSKNQDELEVKVLEEHTESLKVLDFSVRENAKEQANIFMQQEFIRPFDLLSGSPLHHFILIKVSDEFHYLFSVYHHIITDGWGTSLMFQRLVQNYNELVEYGEVTSEYPFTYATFVEDDSSYHQSEGYLEDKHYWMEKFSSVPDPLLEKIDKSKRINQSRRKELTIKRKLYNRLIELAKDYKASTFHVILAILYAYFGRKHNQTDFAIGLPVLNRGKRLYKKTVGLFMGVSPLRIELDFEQSFKELVNQIRHQLRMDYRHHRFPLGKLIQELQLYQEKEKLFNITLSYEKQDYAAHFQDTKTRVLPLTHQSERVGLAIYIREFDQMEDVKIDFDYNVNYFDESTISQVVDHFQKLLVEILVFSEKKIGELSYLTTEEKQQLLVEFNDTAARLPKGKTVLDIFREKVQQYPDKDAIQDHQRSYTYTALDRRSDQVAKCLAAAAETEQKLPVAVLMHRSANLILTLLAILKQGRPFIPLDPSFPEERIRYILDNSQTRLLIKDQTVDLEVDEAIKVLHFEDLLKKEWEGEELILKKPSTRDSAYIIYTSGSTGDPKGVEIGHRALLNFLLSMAERPGINTEDVLFSVTTPAFDISILEFLGPLISGATVYIASTEELAEPQTTIQRIETIQPTIIQATPSFYQMLFSAGWNGAPVLKVLCGGDLLGEALAEKLLDCNQELWNMYGPTEATIWSSIKKIECPEDASNVGKPINNTSMYIMDHFHNPLPIGSQGAIYIGGTGLAKGYFHKEGLTKEKFTKHPFGKRGKIYETGDIGKWNEKGEIIFLGRNDNQVKIRGFRIELGEIETQLNQIPEIQDAVVIAKKDDPQGAFLVAYVIAEHQEISVEQITNALSTYLPEYMIPKVIIPIAEFPLTPNRKVDRKQLMLRSIGAQIAKEQQKPLQSDLEKQLGSFWQESLNIEDLELGPDANFFALGGHSLNGVKLVGLINKTFHTAFGLREVFDYPTISAQAQYLRGLEVSEGSHPIPFAASKATYVLSNAQQHLWLACQNEKMAIAYNMSAAYLLEGEVDLGRIEAAFRKTIEQYEVLRTNFIEVGGIPYQKIKAPSEVDFSIEEVLISEAELDDYIADYTHQAFNLGSDLLIKINSISLPKEQSILVFCTHHLILDGWSLGVLIRKFIENYNQNTNEDAPQGQESTIQFKDYTEWLVQDLKAYQQKNERFWRAYLDKYQIKPAFSRELQHIRTNMERKEHPFDLGPVLTASLKELAIAEKTTLHNLLVTSLAILIFKYSGHDDICLAIPNSGRTRPEILDQPGMFVKTNILRAKMEQEEQFCDFLSKAHNTLLEIDQYQDIPPHLLSEGLWDVLFNYQNQEVLGDQNIPLSKDLKLNYYPITPRYCRLPIVVNVFEKNNCLQGYIEFNSTLYSRETMEIIALKWIRLCEALVVHPKQKILALDIALEIEKRNRVEIDLNF